MQPIGTDRVRDAGNGRIVLLSRHSKGWEPRIEKTATSAEHPGTAIFCGDACYEVVSAVAQEGTAVRYVLDPWRDEHAIRVTDHYDQATEQLREKQRLAAVTREKHRKGTVAAGILAGNLPAIVQEKIGSELGVFPARMSLVSMILPFAFVAWVVWDFACRTMRQEGPPPLALLLLAGYLAVETETRFTIAFMQGRPAGSAIGLFFYLIAWATGPRDRMVSPFAAPAGSGSRITTSAGMERSLQDELLLKEPLVTLLSVDEQHALEARFGYDYRRQSRATAIRLLVISIIGVVTSITTLRHTPRLSAAAALVVALLLGAEQVLRLNALRRGPAPSALAPLARPLIRKLLAAPPPASEGQVDQDAADPPPPL